MRARYRVGSKFKLSADAIENYGYWVSLLFHRLNRATLASVVQFWTFRGEVEYAFA